MKSTNPLRAMIVDDEAPAREGLRLRLKRESDVLIVGEFGDVASALEALRADPPDVLFLDIEMPFADGFALLDRARDLSLPAVVFVTAHHEHAVRAFGARALDYLLKPLEQERLHESLERVRTHLDRLRDAELAERVRGVVREGDGSSTAAIVPAPRGLERIPVSHDGTIQFIHTKDIDHISASGDSVIVHVGRETHSLRKSMGDVIAMLDPATFVRIHRSAIVNLDRVVKLEPYFHGEYMVLMQGGAKLKLSRGYRVAVSRFLGL
ncbi:MAG: LytTR family DNA-binding domain-containing protein [bacterium]